MNRSRERLQEGRGEGDVALELDSKTCKLSVFYDVYLKWVLINDKWHLDWKFHGLSSVTWQQPFINNYQRLCGNYQNLIAEVILLQLTDHWVVKHSNRIDSCDRVWPLTAHRFCTSVTVTYNISIFTLTAGKLPAGFKTFWLINNLRSG